MYIDVPQIEIVEETQVLRDHFKYAYSLFGEDGFEQTDEYTWKAFTGIDYPFLNVVYGEGADIDEQSKYFRNKNVSYAWYIEPDAKEFKQKLSDKDFQFIGTFQALIGDLEYHDETSSLDGYSVKLVDDESSMHEFSQLVCKIFEMQDVAGYHEALWRLANDKMYHWIFYKDDMPVSTLSTCIDGDFVSFWNGSTLAEYRNQGITTKLSQIAINHAIDEGCQKGLTYLMADGMAFGISEKLGGKIKWKFDVYLAPTPPKQKA